MRLTKYHADWCQPCKTLTVIMKGMTYDEVDVEAEAVGGEAHPYNVRALPTLVLSDENGFVSMLVGLRSRQEISRWLSENNASDLG